MAITLCTLTIRFLGQTCCARDCPQPTVVVIVVPNQRQTTSLVDAVPWLENNALDI